MPRSPKAIGTAGESAARRWLNDNGFPEAERRALAGSADTGDLTVCRQPLIVAEVKAGKTADLASVQQKHRWLHAELAPEVAAAGAVFGVLIVARKHRSPALWEAWMPATDWAMLLTGDVDVDADHPMCATVQDWADLASGWAEL